MRKWGFIFLNLVFLVSFCLIAHNRTSSGSVMILDMKLKENGPTVERVHITPGYTNELRFKSQIILAPGQNDKYLLYLLNSHQNILFKTSFDFPRARTIPRRLPAIHDKSSSDSPDILLIEEPEVSLVIPYFKDAAFMEIYCPDESQSALVKSIEKIDFSYPGTKSLALSRPEPPPAEQGKLHILIIASGFDSSNMAEFNTKAQELRDYLLSKEPFQAYSSFIEIDIYPNTADLGCYTGCYGIPRLICCTDSQVMAAAAASGYLFDEIIVMHNTSTYSGGGYRENLDAYKTNSYSSYAMVYKGTDFKKIALHELGHSFGNLCDEYTYATTIYTYSLCVNCCSDCNTWSHISSGCQQGCDARSDYFRPEDSIMLSGSFEYFNQVSIYATYLPDGLEKRLAYFLGGSTRLPEISLDRNSLNFGTIAGSAAITTSTQNFTISNSGGGTLNWGAAADQNWLDCSPASGTNAGIVSVSVDPTGLSTGTYTGNISVSDLNALNTPQTVNVTLKVYNSGSSSGPFGDFGTPLNGAAVSSSIPVTGWVLDDVDVESVKIYSGQTYIGDALFVEGARPGVEQAYPGYPKNYRAGWGYMLLTNFLPGGGNGQYTLNVVAKDLEGYQATLGSKTIMVDNFNAVKPFGAIDTPSQGGTASGSSFKNNGWVLTPMPAKIPEDGSTIKLYIDGVLLGNAATYNIYRSDIAGYFPGYANSGGAGVRFTIDTTAFTNGVHVIYWIAADNAGNDDGIGSRYFTVQNFAGGREHFILPPDMLAKIPPDDSSPVKIHKGYHHHADAEPQTIYPDDNGIIHIEINELERLEVHFSDLNVPSSYSGYHVVGEQLKPLPIGSTLDRRRGIFYWQAGQGFYGGYAFLFIKEQGNIKEKIQVKITISPGS